MRPLQVGVQLPEVERDVGWPEYAAIARAAEEAGFDSIWLGDHLLYRDDGREERGPWEAWTLLSALAVVTESVQLGPLVSCLSFHPPGLVAKMAVTLDEVSQGRFVLGVGAGWNETEYRAFGLPFDRRVSRFEEAFAIVRPLVAGERVTFSGRFFRADDAVLLPRPSRRVPLMVGTDAWNCWYTWYGNTTEGFADLNSRIDAAADAAGRVSADVERSACVLVQVEEGARRQPADSEIDAVPANRLADHLGDLADAGADEAILVLQPITEESIRTVGATLARLDS
jgi:alkanesulfonate monooxygenase SsuD/methylene tetrahydromethanopterin reductase-like flavin-dependent oxidoreductase (luciferase family)